MSETEEKREAGRPAPLFRIEDARSFVNLTSPPHELAGLYAYAQLDSLIELARLISGDFFARPHIYTELAKENETAEKLARLNARTGSDELLLSREQRQAIFGPLFGEDSVQPASDFVRFRDGLLHAAAIFSEWSQATGEQMQREEVRTEHWAFKRHLVKQAGASATWSRITALPSIADDTAYPILRDGGVIAVFGVTGKPSDDWPFVEDADGDQVVDLIGARLAPGAGRAFTRQGFSAQQRVALRGAEAIAAVLAYDEAISTPDDLDELITRCYTWHRALKAWHSPGTLSASHNGNM